MKVTFYAAVILFIPFFFAFGGYTSQLPVMALGGGLATLGALIHVVLRSDRSEDVNRILTYVGFAIIAFQIIGGHRIPGVERTLVRVAPILNCAELDACRGNTRIIGGHGLEPLS